MLVDGEFPPDFNDGDPFELYHLALRVNELVFSQKLTRILALGVPHGSGPEAG